MHDVGAMAVRAPHAGMAGRTHAGSCVQVDLRIGIVSGTHFFEPHWGYVEPCFIAGSALNALAGNADHSWV